MILKVSSKCNREKNFKSLIILYFITISLKTVFCIRYSENTYVAPSHCQRKLQEKGESVREREPVAALRPIPRSLPFCSHVILTGNRASPWSLHGCQSWSVRSSFNKSHPRPVPDPSCLKRFMKIYRECAPSASIVGDTRIHRGINSHRAWFAER